MSRDAILKKIKKAEAGGESFELPQALPAGPVFNDPVTRFRREFEALGGIFHETKSSEEIRKILEQVLTDNEAESIAWETKEVLDRTGCKYPAAYQFSSEDFFTCSLHNEGKIEEQLNLTNMDRTSGELGGIEISVSEAAAGIAETGSIVENAAENGSRVMPILAPVHVVLLPVERLVGSQLDFFESFQPGNAGSAQIIMSGASRTADIEKTLIVGVHGPKKLYVILMRQMENGLYGIK